MFKKILEKWRKWRFPYKPLVEVTIDQSNILHNLHFFQNVNKKVAVAPVLKSNAYGHGLSLIAKILDKENLPFLIVDSYYEAMILRNNSVKTPILILGYTVLENIVKNKLKDLAFTIVSIDQLKEISTNLKSPARFHLKIDTDMHRQGVTLKYRDEAINLSRANKNILLEGLCSHLANSDSSDKSFNEHQIKIWNDQTEIWSQQFPTIKYFHLSNTGGFSYSKETKANVARLGIGLYGIDPTENEILSDLKPALEMKTVISGTKNIKKGEKVGYSITFEANKDMRIATFPAGYYEGIDRSLSSKGFVKIGDKFAPIVGRVSMNITTIDITDLPEAKLNSEVTVISKVSSDKNSIINNAKTAGKIPYDLMVHIPQGLRKTCKSLLNN
jgi:alanine racemase